MQTKLHAGITEEISVVFKRVFDLPKRFLHIYNASSEFLDYVSK
jgi:hypothetical protein